MPFFRNTFAVAGGVTITAVIAVLFVSIATLISMTALLPVVGLIASQAG